MEQAKVQATEWLGGNWQMHTYTTRAGEEAGCCAREKHTVGKANRCRERGEGESRANNRGAKRDSAAKPPVRAESPAVVQKVIHRLRVGAPWLTRPRVGRTVGSLADSKRDSRGLGASWTHIAPNTQHARVDK